MARALLGVPGVPCVPCGYPSVWDSHPFLSAETNSQTVCRHGFYISPSIIRAALVGKGEGVGREGNDSK